ncbi:MAG TPA: hypothetical protein VH988_03285 [Thermoanaerobaculia bacterium]|jgi:hypothetical protein|nr:hypothetical protein [Thermoanaerobaculia bacterium]
MLQLRIKQQPLGDGRHRVDLDLTGDGAPRAATCTFPFHLSPQDEEGMRWYLEDFLQYPQAPAPMIARRIEGRIAEMGTELFKAVFQANNDARKIWSRVEERLPETRIEIISGVTEAATIPWELLREPEADIVLALTAHSFVRAQPNTARAPQLPANEEGKKIRILLVICRPRGAQDVPFRSVASRLIRGLGAANREAYDLDVLRPPTFEQLGRVLRQAQIAGQPYHVVHFDGHGAYMEVKEPGALGALLGHLTSIVLAAPRAGKRGFLWFENPQLQGNGELVDGTSLGQFLAATGVPVIMCSQQSDCVELVAGLDALDGEALRLALRHSIKERNRRNRAQPRRRVRICSSRCLWSPNEPCRKEPGALRAASGSSGRLDAPRRQEHPAQ